MSTHDRPANIPARWDIIEGSYLNTTDDRAGRWYIVDRDADVIDKRGPGHATRRAAWDAILGDPERYGPADA